MSILNNETDGAVFYDNTFHVTSRNVGGGVYGEWLALRERELESCARHTAVVGFYYEQTCLSRIAKLVSASHVR